MLYRMFRFHGSSPFSLAGRCLLMCSHVLVKNINDVTLTSWILLVSVCTRGDITYIINHQDKRKRVAATMRGLCLLLYVAVWCSLVVAYSTSGSPRQGKISEPVSPANRKGRASNPPRGNVLQNCVARRTAISTTWYSFVTLVSLPKQSHAACLFGDTSPDCIGVYKMPMDDSALSYVDTPEKLAKNAPDVRWVPPVQYPKSYTDARAELASLQKRCAALPDLVLKGNLTNVGIEILGIIPRLTVAGRVVIQSLDDAKNKQGVDMSMKAYRAEVAHTALLNMLGQCDVLIGQAISGQLGAIAPAQLHILEDVGEANVLFNEFTKSIPDDFKPGDKKSH